jgi:hypothetical protein
MWELWGSGEAVFLKGAVMDDRLEHLQAEFCQSSRRTAELKVELDYAQGKIVRGSIPHYILIERAAHEVGQVVSRMAQEIPMDRLASEQPHQARCPGCGGACQLTPTKREVTSIDGEVSLQELQGHCPRCRRDFFPDARAFGL